MDGIDGLLHITDMTWKRIKHPSEMVELGQRLEVMILNIDKEKGRVALGLNKKSQILGMRLNKSTHQVHAFQVASLTCCHMALSWKLSQVLKGLFMSLRCLG